MGGRCEAHHANNRAHGLKVLLGPRVEADSAAGIHAAEGHFLWRTTVKGLQRET